MEILLLNPPTPDNRAFIREGRCNQEQGVWSTLWPPLSLAVTGALLEREGHRVCIIDCAAAKITHERLLHYIGEHRFGMAVWSTATPSIESDLTLAADIHAVDKNITTAAFGTHVTALPDECLEMATELDFIIRGEPEMTLAALAAALENREPVEKVEGVSCRKDGGRVFHAPPRPPIENPDRLPFPAWHLVDTGQYRLPLSGEKFLMISPIRGCPFSCTFCTAQTYYGRKGRKRGVENVVDEIEYDISRFGIRQFFIWADTFTMDKGYVENFCREIGQRGLDIKWTCNSRVDTVDPGILNMMARAGCWMISFGIESASPQVLDSIGKKVTPEQSRAAVAAAKKAGIRTAGHFVLGFPDDTGETLKQTIDFSLTLGLDTAQYYCAVPFPGSSLYETARKSGFIHSRPFSEFHQENAVMDLPHLPPETVNAYRRTAYRRFYARPGVLLGLLKLVRPGGIGKSIRGGIEFIRWGFS